MSSIRNLALAATLLMPGTLACQDDDAKGFSPNPTVQGDIIETAQAAGSFTTLATALEAAGLVETLKGEGPFTVFAPTDEAFAKLPEGALDALLQNKEALTAVLTYHVVPGRVTAEQVVNLSSAPTVNGQQLSIDVQDGSVKVDEATVTETDIEASNGIIHVIDAVLLPE